LSLSSNSGSVGGKLLDAVSEVLVNNEVFSIFQSLVDIGDSALSALATILGAI